MCRSDAALLGVARGRRQQICREVGKTLRQAIHVLVLEDLPRDELQADVEAGMGFCPSKSGRAGECSPRWNGFMMG